MTKFLLLRHGQTDFTGKLLLGRRPGISLNDEGREQARALASRLSDMPISAIYSSPLERVAETAAALAQTHHLSCNISEAFLELDFGNWTNKSIQELESDAHFKLFNLFRSSARIPGGEMMLEAQMRIVTGLERLRHEHRDQTVAIFSHADIIKSAICYYAGIHLDMSQRIEISPASLSILEIYDETARIVVVNDTSHLSRL